jgi:hypothetical protein
MGVYRDLTQSIADSIVALGDQLDADLGDAAPPDVLPPAGVVLSGVYTGDNDGDGSSERSFGEWRDRPPEVVLSFTPDDKWDTSWWVSKFGGNYPFRDRLVITRGLCLNNETVDSDLPGDVFADWARAVRDAGIVDPVWRLGHEATGSWYPWAIRKGDSPSSYARRFDEAARQIRSVTPDARVCLCLAAGQSNDGFEWPTSFDLLGVDTYDREGHSETWPEYVALAADFGVPLCVPEWGLWQEDDGGQGDNPSYIDAFADWSSTALVGGHEAYFNKDSSGEHKLDHYPNASARYLERFGGASS